MTVYRHVLVGAFLVVVAAGPAGAQQVTNEFFEAKIRPVLAAKCYACHNSKMKEPKGYLTLDSREGVMKGGHARARAGAGKPGRQQTDSRAEVCGSASADAAERQARR